MESIQGEVKTIIYRNEENGFTVLELVDADGDEITAVGPLPLCSVGERVELTGDWTAHKTYGRQFRAEQSRTLAPATLYALISYLGGGLIKGVGESTARSIVATFGMDTLSVLENEPERLAEVPGIGRVRAGTIAGSFAAQKDMRDIMLALQEYGVSVTQAVKLYRIYGPLCLGKIRENPYCLITDVENIGFKTADKIAAAAGFAHDSPFRLKAGVRYTLQWAAREGHTCLPREKLIQVAQNVLEAETLPVEQAVDELTLCGELVCKQADGADMVFLPTFAYMEQECARRLAGFARAAQTPLLLLAARIEELEREFGVRLAPEQKRAVELALASGALVITGGPGTGKTTILRFIIRLAERMGLEYELCAPTGRAAKRMGEAAGCEARTIHRMLEYGQGEGVFGKNEADPLLTDLLIVDEMSMVDVPLLFALLRALTSGTRLIMVGDADQLPSVGPGNVLRDIISSGLVPVVRLTDIYRQSERSAIVMNAHAVNRGEPVDLSDKPDFGFEQLESPEAILARLIALYAGRTNRLDTRDPLRDVQVLSPMKKGPLGVYQLNAKLQAALNPPARHKRERTFGETIFREGDKVMQIKNDYRLDWTRTLRGRELEKGSGVYNGDLGTVMRIDTVEQTVEVLFDDERCALYDFPMLDELELAYCISIHKSQGSEFPVVVLPLSGGPPMLMTRNLLYTAITRARRQVYIVGREQSVARMIANNEVRKRYSALKSFLESMAL